MLKKPHGFMVLAGKENAYLDSAVANLPASVVTCHAITVANSFTLTTQSHNVSYIGSIRHSIDCPAYAIISKENFSDKPTIGSTPASLLQKNSSTKRWYSTPGLYYNLHATSL
jgi:hypothetical protein